ncbi:sodium-dependent nutrient amino acid transporter 1-like [Hyalella azteca]|uniref:Sodium-dependent nutrient amino acid transporter 1 n=1 Tax=Hyalella azteca TaxID=294128 RepID=A0A979FFK1_HYAAZ|nr:sodium-dependent nutrient amino acid transporter 1-like [Hyalella azteca]
MYGGAYLYLTIALHILVGLPILYIQMLVGRVTGKDTYLLIKGFGRAYTSLAVLMILNLVLTLAMAVPFLAQILYYFILSFNVELPWAECDESWALTNCVPVAHLTTEVLMLLTTIMSYLIALVFCTPGGYYVLQLLDFISVCVINNLIALVFLVAVLCVFGVREFVAIIQD